MVKAKANVAIVLKDDSQTLDELVVVGYGVQKKENLTGAVASMNAEKLATRPVSSLSSALAGEMAGVTAVQAWVLLVARTLLSCVVELIERCLSTRYR